MSEYNFVYDPNYGKRFRICASGSVHFDGETCNCPEITGERYRSISPRFAPLHRKGLIYASGKRRAAQTGRTVQTWRAA
jgi:hypothetical protein